MNNLHVEAKGLVHSAKDGAFIDDLLAITNAQLMNPELDVEFVCSSTGMSRTKLYQKNKSITGQSVNDFIRTIRLRKAKKVMTQEDVSLTEVMFRPGIQTQSCFTKAFKKRLVKRPHSF